ncbi:hypothetical protein YC2023_011238 [Brassica napus]
MNRKDATLVELVKRKMSEITSRTHMNSAKLLTKKKLTSGSKPDVLPINFTPSFHTFENVLE